MGIRLNPELERRIALQIESGHPIWEVVAEMGASVPEDAWESVPADLSKNLHHYLYGAPKEEV